MSSHRHRHGRGAPGKRNHAEGGHRRERSKAEHCGISGAIHRVIRGSRDATGLGKGPTIALYVVGFVFMPLLTTLVFLAMLYWTSFPSEARRNLDRVSQHTRKVGERLTESLTGSSRRYRASTEPDFADELRDFVPEREDGHEPERRREPAQRRERATDGVTRPADIQRKFDDLERRANAIEEFVTSEEYRLEREFEKMRNKDRAD